MLASCIVPPWGIDGAARINYPDERLKQKNQRQSQPIQQQQIVGSPVPDAKRLRLSSPTVRVTSIDKLFGFFSTFKYN